MFFLFSFIPAYHDFFFTADADADQPDAAEADGRKRRTAKSKSDTKEKADRKDKQQRKVRKQLADDATEDEIRAYFSESFFSLFFIYFPLTDTIITPQRKPWR